jgi:hypothetical protein
MERLRLRHDTAVPKMGKGETVEDIHNPEPKMQTGLRS